MQSAPAPPPPPHKQKHVPTPAFLLPPALFPVSLTLCYVEVAMHILGYLPELSFSALLVFRTIPLSSPSCSLCHVQANMRVLGHTLIVSLVAAQCSSLSLRSLVNHLHMRSR